MSRFSDDDSREYMQENGPTPRCPECNHKAPEHAAFCRAGIDESRPMTEVRVSVAAPFTPTTSAERYRGLPVGGDVVGPAAPDPRPQGERYFPLDNSIAEEAFVEHDPPDITGLPPCFEPEDAAYDTTARDAVLGLANRIDPPADPIDAQLCPDCEANPFQAHAKNCPTMLRAERQRAGRAFGEPASAEELHLAATDPVAAARARAASAGLNPKDLVGAVKTPLGLLPWTALVQVAGVFKVGADKYGAYNWRTKGQPVQHVTYVEAAFRHLAAYMDGQTIDPETGCNHLAHAACGLLILLDASAVGNSIDNRPTPGLAAEIMATRK